MRIVHISDTHVGAPEFRSELFTECIKEVNELSPDFVVHTGDLTNDGYRYQFEDAYDFLDKIETEIFIVPGNHDARNVGYLHFEEIFGARYTVFKDRDLLLVGVDTSEPDLEDGHLGRERQIWLENVFKGFDGFKIFLLHHHLVSVPFSGRERGVLYDAGEVLKILTDCNVDLVLSGHKHVPNAWRLENMFIINAGTASSLRLRGLITPCYNIIDIEEGEIKATLKFVGGALRDLLGDRARIRGLGLQY
jgi:putative phosphoesterase